MTQFEKEYFQKIKFSKDQIDLYFHNALKDLKISQEDPIPEVKFTYSYQALIKAGITLLAKIGHAKVRSIPGHHVKILTKMGEILKNEDIFAIGNAMRMKRNLDFYGGGESVSEKEAKEYLEFVESVFQKIKEVIDKEDIVEK